ncbi:MAG: hypothetical protein ABIR96_09355 [Bdellovibrionota bacterium]
MANRMQPKRYVRTIFFGSALLASASVKAADFRLGVNLGFGGAGITMLRNLGTDSEPKIATVQRAQGPGVLNLSVDQILTKSWAVSFEHSRGFTLAPFSSRVHFTGIAGRYYITPSLDPLPGPSDETVLRIKRIAFYVGASTGVAIGTVTLEGDLVPSVTSSGIYFGGKGGAEYAISTSMGIRTEINYALTLSSSGKNPSNMTLFGAQLGVFFFL